MSRATKPFSILEHVAAHGREKNDGKITNGEPVCDEALETYENMYKFQDSILRPFDYKLGALSRLS